MRIKVFGEKPFSSAVRTMLLSRGHELFPVLDRHIDLIITAHSLHHVTREERALADWAIGYHPSLLPLHRGPDAIRWTIAKREPVTGGSVYQLTDEMDAGEIYAQDWCLVGPHDTARTLWSRELYPMGLRLLDQVVQTLDRQGYLVGRPQDPFLATTEPVFSESQSQPA